MLWLPIVSWWVPVAYPSAILPVDTNVPELLPGWLEFIGRGLPPGFDGVAGGIDWKSSLPLKNDAAAPTPPVALGSGGGAATDEAG